MINQTPPSIILLQARTSSRRLPGKVLLPLKGMPTVVVAAKRAQNTGRDLIVATSSEPSDDFLVQLIQNYGLKYYRGSLHNVLDRFLHALSHYPDDTLVFRLTADNVFPDGVLLDAMASDFLDRKLDYLICNGEGSGVPYGLSVEVAWLKHLRETPTESSYEQEHVTLHLARRFGRRYFEQYKHLTMGHYRCTIDNLDDYLNVQKVFDTIDDPISVTFLDLIDRLANNDVKPLSNHPAQKLVLGTAQLGMLYGIANTTGIPLLEDAERLLKTAVINGALYIDTARAYGKSEEIIGNFLQNGWKGRVKVITKLLPFKGCPDNASYECVSAFVESSVFQSIAKLCVEYIDVLMVHHASYLFQWNGFVWDKLLNLKKLKIIKHLGVSIQNPEELIEVLKFSEINFIQIPINILDWRWDHLSSEISRVKTSRPLIIHARSTLLQGLLTSPLEVHWNKAHVKNMQEIRDWLENQRVTYNKTSIASLCLSYIQSLPWVDGIVVGAENLAQLNENITCLTNNKLTNLELKELTKKRPHVKETTLNPSLWQS